MTTTENQIELDLIAKLGDLKYTYRPDIRDRADTWHFANNNARHFSFNADELFLPVYQPASKDNKKITQLDTVQSQKIDTLTLHKKGLMQQLFPALDEVPA